ncbi:MAG: FAD-binding oxidoreductase [Simkaniaceae bacterium]|nr:FAD-binding oxidoreductase [Simkaniaceae bacterium]
MNRSKHVAVIGAGFAGLGTCYYLLRLGYRVTLFDQNEIGNNTSSVASGLVHPFPGQMARISLFEKEGVSATRQLIEEVQKHSMERLIAPVKMLRVAVNEKQEERFDHLCKIRDDVSDAKECFSFIKEGKRSFWIHSGMTIFSEHYIKALFDLCIQLGLDFKKVAIESPNECADFDTVVLTLGAGSDRLLNLKERGFKINRGQILQVKWSGKRELPSILGKGYLAPSQKPGIYHLGSTYEYDHLDEPPDNNRAICDIFRQAGEYLSIQDAFEVIDVKAGMRLAKKSSYLPYLNRLSNRVWILTAMGSRGLLYHAYCSQLLASAIDRNHVEMIPNEMLLE